MDSECEPEMLHKANQTEMKQEDYMEIKQEVAEIYKKSTKIK